MRFCGAEWKCMGTAALPTPCRNCEASVTRDGVLENPNRVGFMSAEHCPSGEKRRKSFWAVASVRVPVEAIVAARNSHIQQSSWLDDGQELCHHLQITLGIQDVAVSAQSIVLQARVSEAKVKLRYPSRPHSLPEGLRSPGGNLRMMGNN